MPDLTPAQYAERAGMSPDTVRALIRAGHLGARVVNPAAKIHRYRITEADIRRYEMTCRS